MTPDVIPSERSESRDLHSLGVLRSLRVSLLQLQWQWQSSIVETFAALSIDASPSEIFQLMPARCPVTPDGPNNALTEARR